MGRGSPPWGVSPAGPDRFGEACLREETMGYVLFILIAFVMLAVDRIVSHHHASHGHHPNRGA